MRRICVFCGSAEGARLAYRDAARALGRELATRGLGLVYGGGSVGLMGVLADTALAEGGEGIGVIPGPLATRELPHTGLPELRGGGPMHQRKAPMARPPDGVVRPPRRRGRSRGSPCLRGYSRPSIRRTSRAKPVCVGLRGACGTAR